MRILTALGIQSLFKKLKNIKEFNLYKIDIQYREAILEILKKDNNFNLIIIYEKLTGEISFEELINKIKIINNEIKIIFLLENKNDELEKILFNKNIKNIFYNNEINFEEFIFKIKNINFSEEELLKKEIEKLNKIISEKNNEIIKYKNNKSKNKKINNKNENKNLNLKNKKEFNKMNNYEKNNFIKSVIITEINYEKFKIIRNKMKKLNKQSFLFSSKIEYLNLNEQGFLYRNKKIKYYDNIIFILNMNLEEIKKINKIINLIKIKYLIKDEKINIIFIKNKYNSINLKILKNIFKNYNVLDKIKLNM